MKVTMVGAGNMGRGIGTRTVAGGHEVEIVDRDPAEAERVASELGSSANALDPGAPFGGEIVVLALYYPGAARPRASARAARLPAHLAPAAARARLREHDQTAPIEGRSER